MKPKGLVVNGLKSYIPFHQRHKGLLVFCTLAGLRIRAVDRIYPNGWKRKLLYFWSLLMHLFLSSVTINSLIHLFFFKQKDIYEFVHVVMMIGCSTHGTFRQYYMFKNINKFDDLYQAWDELFGKDRDWKPRQKAIDEHYKGAKIAIGFLGVFTTIMLTIYALSKFYAPDKVFRFPTIFPYRHQSPDFEIMASLFALGIFLFALAVGSSQMLLVLPIIWELGELTRLKNRLMEIFKESEALNDEIITIGGERVTAKTYTASGIQSVNFKLKIWVEQHQKLTTFHKMSMKLNNFELGMEMFATLIEACGMAILCSSDYYIPIDQVTTMLTFTGYFALFYYSCAKCNELSDSSMSVPDDAFAENWSSLPIKLKKNLMMILARTHQPLNFYGAIIFQVDIKTFNQIMQTAYSVFNFFFAVVHKF